MLSDTVGERIMLWRKRRGWSREKLSEVCTQIGLSHLSEAVITNIESGRRTSASRRRVVSIDELVVFSIALSVPLDTLVIPYPSQETMELFPGMTMPTADVLHWFEGNERISIFDDPDAPEIWKDARAPRALLRTHAELVTEWHQQAKAVADASRAVAPLAEAERQAEMADAAARAAVSVAHQERDTLNRARAEADRQDVAYRGPDPAEAEARVSNAMHTLDSARAALFMARGRHERAQEAFRREMDTLGRIETNLRRTRNTMESKGYPLPTLSQQTKHLAEQHPTQIAELGDPTTTEEQPT